MPCIAIRLDTPSPMPSPMPACACLYTPTDVLTSSLLGELLWWIHLAFCNKVKRAFGMGSAGCCFSAWLQWAPNSFFLQHVRWAPNIGLQVAPDVDTPGAWNGSHGDNIFLAACTTDCRDIGICADLRVRKSKHLVCPDLIRDPRASCSNPDSRPEKLIRDPSASMPLSSCWTSMPEPR